jgi:PAS domain S-box-containing protein
MGVAGSVAGQVLHDGVRTRVLRVASPDGAGHVVRKEARGPEAVARIRHETGILRRLDGVAGVPRLCAVPEPGSAWLEVRDEGRQVLRDRLAPAPPAGSAAALDLAVALARVLAEVHRRGVIHRDVNPANLLVTADLAAVTLIDFDLAITFAYERPDFVHQNGLVGTAEYLAPEQTGRTGRPVDHRADLYGLGATLYEVLTGRPPFESDDALALIRDHLARLPVPPAERDGSVPPDLSRVVMRLLEKEPDRRYQSADGLLHDLLLIRDGVATGAPHPGQARPALRLGERDFPLRLSAPSRPVGRDGEIRALRAAFEDARHGRCRGVLVSGAPGVGKTTLIDELRSVVAAAGGWFVGGKFDQFRRDPSSDGVHQALSAVGRLLLAEPEAELAASRERIVRSLGPDPRPLVSVGPDLAALFGAHQPDDGPVPAEGPADPAELRARLVRSAVGLLAAVTSPARPVVIVLDDLQWAASTPIAVVDALLTDPEIDGLLVVGAFREAEVDQAHPLTAQLSRWERLGVAPAAVHLSNLPPEDLGTMLGTVLRLPPERAAELAEAVGARTAGNPYDTLELVNALRQEGALIPGPLGWTWDAAAIRGHVGRGDVVDLLRERIGRLPPATGELLETLACLGGEVGLDLLAAATTRSAQNLADQLAPAMEDGLLVGAQARDDVVRFRHDRVQQAAHAGLDGPAGVARHLELARRLAGIPALAGIAAAQYLRAVAQVREPQERRRAATLFRAAAGDLRLLDYVAAERFLAAARELLTEGSGLPADPADTDLLIAVEIEWHAALCSLSRLDDGDAVYASLTRRCDDPARLAPATFLQIGSLTNRQRTAEAMVLGLDALRRLGVAVPEPGQMAAQVEERADGLCRWATTGSAAQDLLRPEITDPRLRAIAMLAQRLSATAFTSDPLTMFWLMTESQRLWDEHGPSAPLVPLAGAGLTTIALRGDYRAGYDSLERVIEVGRARGYQLETAQAMVLKVLGTAHWFEPLDDCIRTARVAREALIAAGDLQGAAFAFITSVLQLIDVGPTVDAALAEADAATAFALRTGNDYVLTSFIGCRQLIRAVRGETRAPSRLDDEDFDTGEFLRQLAAVPVNVASTHVARGQLAAIMNDDDELDVCAAALGPFLPILTGTYAYVGAQLVRGLSFLREVSRADGTERGALLAEADGVRAWFAARAQDAPGNYGHLVSWLDAGRAGAVGDVAAALAAFDAALRAADTRQRPWHRALIAEHAGTFHLDNGMERSGRALLAEARDGFAAWGAPAKVERLQQRYPFLAGIHRERHEAVPGSLRGTVAVSADAVDLLAVLRASQALSSETNLDRLRARVVEVLADMTGATGVRLLLWNDEAAAWSLLPDGGDAGLDVDEAAARGLLPLSAFRYADRTREPLLVGDATLDDRFARDPYLAGLDCCSLLVVPILAHGAPRAMLVLENRLSGHAFTAERLDAVMLVAGQLAVSIENALAERFRSLVQRSSDLIVVCDRRGTLSYVSAASVDLIGVEASELAGRDLAEVLHPDEREAFRGWLGQVDGTDGQAPEWRLLADSGEERWVQVGFTDLTIDPAVGGIVLHLRDVTERRRLETELRHAQKLESVGQLAAGIAHEINTPIQFVGDNLRFLSDAFGDLARLVTAGRTAARADGAAGGPAARSADAAVSEIDADFLLTEVPGALEETLDGVSRVATIVRAMKAFGHFSEEKAPADLNEAVHSTLVVAGGELRDVADVVTDLGDLPPVHCNAGDINQVLLNLVVNAAHAIGAKVAGGGGRGTVTVRTRRDGDHVTIEVRDTGVGIPPDIADRVFDQFFTTKDVGTGTGQGLALAHALVHQRHNGTITFTSEPGVGTTFTVRLPIESQAG